MLLSKQKLVTCQYGKLEFTVWQNRKPCHFKIFQVADGWHILGKKGSLRHREPHFNVPSLKPNQIPVCYS